MFIGHFGLGMAAKKYMPEVSLGVLFLSVQLVDLLWPFFLLMGLEVVRIEPGYTTTNPLNFVDYPITHSLLGGLLWAIAFGGIYFLIKRSKKTAYFLAGGVISHWFLDLLMHRPDLAIYPGGSKYGFGMWESLPLTMAIEFLLFTGGIYLYLKCTKANDKAGVWSFWSLMVFLTVGWLGSLFGPPPPTSEALAYSALSMWLMILWGFWIDKHRSPVELNNESGTGQISI